MTKRVKHDKNADPVYARQRALKGKAASPWSRSHMLKTPRPRPGFVDGKPR